MDRSSQTVSDNLDDYSLKNHAPNSPYIRSYTQLLGGYNYVNVVESERPIKIL